MVLENLKILLNVSSEGANLQLGLLFVGFSVEGLGEFCVEALVDFSLEIVLYCELELFQFSSDGF